MHKLGTKRRIFATRIAIAFALCQVFGGCTRSQHRLNADREAYCTIAERNQDPRWAVSNLSIDLDPRSRYYDPYNPDCSPMPADDPTSHRYMHCVDGMKGWKHWDDNGTRAHLENPAWRAQLAEYAEIDPQGSVKLGVDSSVRLAYLHSPLHQRSLETLYLTSLDVTGERFRLDTQFFGGNGVSYDHQGGLAPATISFIPAFSRYFVTGPFDVPESNRQGISTDLQATRRLATAGEVLVGFANSFAFEFTGGNVNLASSLANFSFVQPLLRGAGRDVALEQLTLSERRLLANLRAYSQFRQGFFTQVLIGELGVTGPQRFGNSTVLQSFSGFGGVGGYLGLLQQAQQIRNTEDNLRLQLRTRDRLEALHDNELIDIVQVDQFRQNIEVTRANLLDQTNGLELAVDNYKTQVLGLPADLLVNVDEQLVEGFQLIPVEANPVVDALLQLQTRIGDIGELSDLSGRIEVLQDSLASLPDQSIDIADLTFLQFQTLLEAVARRVRFLPSDLAWANEQMRELSDDQQYPESIAAIVARLREQAGMLPAQFEASLQKVDSIIENLNEDNLQSTVSQQQAWLLETLELCHDITRLQSAVRRIELEPESALRAAEQFIEPVQALLAIAHRDLERMDEIAAERERNMRDDERQLFQRDQQRLRERLAELETGESGFAASIAHLEQLIASHTTADRERTIRELTAWIQSYIQLVERLSLIPAQARLEIITVDEVDLEPEAAFQIALSNRLDFMNGRAALVDQWRAIQVAADALQSGLTITGGGDIRTAKNNPVNFRAPTGSLRLGVEFDAPLTRLLERNGYRETLIQYQRSRRDLIQSHDSLQKGLRALLRTLRQRRLQLEIQRRAVSIALRRVEQTQLSLLAPPPPVQPGARPQINPTTAINLLGAQSSLQSSQNSFLSAWLNYYAARLRLFRELGIMQLDPSGRWIEDSVSFGDRNETEIPADAELLPPPLPVDPEAPTASAQTQTPGMVNATERVNPESASGAVSIAIRTVGLPDEVGLQDPLQIVQETTPTAVGIENLPKMNFGTSTK